MPDTNNKVPKYQTKSQETGRREFKVAAGEGGAEAKLWKQKVEHSQILSKRMRVAKGK